MLFRSVFREVLYLFNVIIALEWSPSAAAYQQIRLAAKRASDFLYDVTNGYFAIGQVIIGGPDLMDVADIQIMASNRIHPRAWMSALNDARKFQPIRIGRGLWQKNQGTLLTWDTPEGYRGLVHEWGHYAFGLPDEYLRPIDVSRKIVTGRFWAESDPPASAPTSWTRNALQIAAPEVALAVESLMANTQISEYADLDKTFAYIQQFYPEAKETNKLEGPDALPLALPYFPELQILPDHAADVAPSRLVINLDASEDAAIPLSDAFQAGTHWLYLLKRGAEEDAPLHLIAQGKIGERDKQYASFRLLGAAAGDAVVLMSQMNDTVVVKHAALVLNSAGNPEPGEWKDMTPPDLRAGNPLFVDVIPEPLTTQASGPMPADLRIHVEAPTPPTSAHLYPSGATPGKAVTFPAGPLSDPIAVPHLDGHVLLRWLANNGETVGIFICGYSQGGGPITSGGGKLPITGGSSDGNAMIFFNDNIVPEGEVRRPNSFEAKESNLRLVTTTIAVGQQQLADGSVARSYIFSLASNGQLGKEHKAALVLYYDSGAPKRGGDLLVYRWDTTSQWRKLTTFAPSDLLYVAIPIGIADDGDELETAPSLTSPNPPSVRVERYRIFLT